ncbi:MAG: hypothetical protein AB8B79_22260 [Granulosicoccus sp.]
MSEARENEKRSDAPPEKRVRKVLGWTLSILGTLGVFYYSLKVSSGSIMTILDYLLFAFAFGVAMAGYNIRK